MNLAAVGTGASLDAPNNPGPAVFYARVGAPSPADPNAEQLITDRPPADWKNYIQNAASSALSLFSGPATVAKATQGIATTAAQQAGYKAAVIKGEVGKVYYGTVSAVSSAVTSTATAAKKVSTTLAWGSYAVIAVIAIVLLAQFRIAAKGV